MAATMMSFLSTPVVAARAVARQPFIAHKTCTRKSVLVRAEDPAAPDAGPVPEDILNCELRMSSQR